MAAMGNKGRSRTEEPADDARRRFMVEAGMLAFLIGLALVFVVTAPS